MAINLKPKDATDQLGKIVDRLVDISNGDSKKFTPDEHKQTVDLVEKTFTDKQSSTFSKEMSAKVANWLPGNDGPTAKNPFSNENLKASYSSGQRSVEQTNEIKAMHAGGKSVEQIREHLHGDKNVVSSVGGGKSPEARLNQSKSRSENLSSKLAAQMGNAKTAGESAKATTDKELDRATKKI